MSTESSVSSIGIWKDNLKIQDVIWQDIDKSRIGQESKDQKTVELGNGNSFCYTSASCHHASKGHVSCLFAGQLNGRPSLNIPSKKIADPAGKSKARALPLTCMSRSIFVIVFSSCAEFHSLMHICPLLQDMLPNRNQ